MIHQLLKYNIIATGSKGNAVLYGNSILVDIGVTFKQIKSYIKDISIVLLTHGHKDHINIGCLKKLCFERPLLRVGCANHMIKYLEGIKNVDVFEIGSTYNYGYFEVSPVKLYHDVPNVGYRIFINDYKIFHATDTAHLQGVEAKEYDLYALEHNYNDETIDYKIEFKENNGEYAYEKGVINSHLSEQQAREFYYRNKGKSSNIIRLHE